MEMTENPSEWIELEELRAIYDSASDELRNKLGLKLEDINGVTCSVSSAEPSIIINRCFVTDQNALTSVDTIKKVKQLYADAGVKEFFLHVTHCTAEIVQSLGQAGMVKSRGWMKFIRDTSPAVARNPDLDIRKIGPEHAEDFARIVVPCFDMKEESIPLVASIVSHPNYHLYVGFEGDTPAATGALFFKEGIGICDWGATHPDFRGRGFQGAMLARRINDGIEMGATNLYTATGEDVPDDPQHSYKNIMRYGFKENYLRENWVPAS